MRVCASIAAKDVRKGASLPLQTAERCGPALKGSGMGPCPHLVMREAVSSRIPTGTALIDEGVLCDDRLTTSSGVNIDAIAITSHRRYSAFSAHC